jgi:2-keto-4-pentenoate hydratase/2-oxohepta-3-ene-1,7-dioic acid hydratase in catechol pathway
MKICRFIHQTSVNPQYAVIENQTLSPLTNSDPFSQPVRASAQKIPIGEAKLLSPVVPTKIVCVGRNYKDHAAELGNKMPTEPLLFLKAPSAIIASGDFIELPALSNQVEHEGELGVVIGREVRGLDERDDPLAYVFGYTCVNDVTARDLQRKDVQFTRAKSFDTFCPVGPFIETSLDPGNLLVTTRVNNQIKQQARTSAMAFSVPFIIRYISQVMTL